MGSRLYYSALLHNHDDVCTLDRRQPMRNDKGGSVLDQFLQSQLNIFFRFGIKRRGGFVQNQNGRILQ